jgi:D-alanyl-lipoteichoic acid acyltransferase DltB (MBOAT superfamily)
MVFNSYEFLFFFPVVTALYFLLPHRMRWVLLLLASCGFYMAFVPKYILILFFTIIVDYFAGLGIARAQGAARKVLLVVSLVANIGVLVYFKYFDFIIGNLNAIAAATNWQADFVLRNIILPIGLSFHTFQAMSYTIEVYRGKQEPERHFGIYALYVMFYPQLVAGPIERPQNLLHQFREVHVFEYARVTSGLKLMAWGLFKKVVIADRLAVLVDGVYGNPANHDGVMLTLASVAFAYQVYCDFSGYSDIARGSAEVMGFHLMRNFRQPYHASSMSDFWRRWHISLSTWFKDYLYIPMGGNRVKPFRQGINLLVVFLVSGFWHGAQWTYVIWGILHGVFLVFGMATASTRQKLRDWCGLSRVPWLRQSLAIAITFSLVTVGWIFFRARTVPDAVYILSHLHTGWDVLARPQELLAALQAVGFSPADVVYSILALLVLMVGHQLQRREPVRELLARQPALLRWSVYYAALACIVLLGVFDRRSFIYFQF